MTTAGRSRTRTGRLTSAVDAELQGRSYERGRLRVFGAQDGSLWVAKFGLRDPLRAVAVHRLAESLGMRIVPETNGVEWGGAFGVAQRLVGGATAHQTPDLPGAVRTVRMVADLAQMVVLDYMVCNPDRHGNNWMVDAAEDRIWAIDNELHDPAVRLAAALRPARRADMDDDPDWTPALQGAMWGATEAVEGRGRSAAAVYRAWAPFGPSARSWDDRAGELCRELEAWCR